MACTQQKQLTCFPCSRVEKKWFRHFNDHKNFHNEETLHLFSLMALYSYANFRSNTRRFENERYMEAPGQWICKLSALPRILRVHSKKEALELMDYFHDAGLLDYERLANEEFHHRPHAQDVDTVMLGIALKTETAIVNHGGVGNLMHRRSRERRQINSLIFEIPAAINRPVDNEPLILLARGEP